jgi:ADP-dependent NAD(P)H-hydrate dehydratase / NAD(P)H-hydrate epimerase
MRALYSCAEASSLDERCSATAALPPLILMEDASVELWRALKPIALASGTGEKGLLLALCGPGNNGGDALALLRHARFSGFPRVAAVLSRRELGKEAALFASSLAALGVELRYWPEERAACERLLAEAALIVDGLTGTGLRGALREGLLSLVAALEAATKVSGAPVAAIDLPSGLSDSFDAGHRLVSSAWTLSVEPRKACLYFPSARESCGEILAIEGVFPVEGRSPGSACLLEEEDLGLLAPLPPESAYKGGRGRVAVFAGSVGASGAAVLASRACLAAGAGIAALFASPETYEAAAARLDAVMVKPESEGNSLDRGRWDAILVGPGWGREGSRRDRLSRLLASGFPAVLDADAILLYRELVDSGFVPSSPIILTPHPGEFAELTGVSPARSLANPPAVLIAAAKSLNAVIVLKSHVTWIASPSGALAAWEGRESGLGTAGSGDVLAGLAAGLLARRAAAPLEPEAAFFAARAAVIAHGLAGRAARASRGWFEAGVLVEEAARLLGARSLGQDTSGSR